MRDTRRAALPLRQHRLRMPVAGRQAMANGAGEGNRTLVSSLGSYSSTIELHPPLLDIITRNGPKPYRLQASPGRAAATCGTAGG